MEMGAKDKGEAELVGTRFDRRTSSLSSSTLIMVVLGGNDATATFCFFILGAGFSLLSCFRFPFDGRFPGKMYI